MAFAKFLCGFATTLIVVATVTAQSDHMCPPNKNMGLCTPVPNPCSNDGDCFNGDICCPDACSRTCKPREARYSVGPMEVPDLLHHPTVYVGKCPDSSCFSFFGGGANECDTKNLCNDQKYCCNDGCKNICHWKPEFEAIIKQQEARRKQEEAIRLQRQRAAVMQQRKKVWEDYQRRQAKAEQARKEAEARAAAEAELAAQQAKVRYEAQITAQREAQAAAIAQIVQARQQASAQMQARAQSQAAAQAAAQARMQAATQAAAKAIANAQVRNTGPIQVPQQQLQQQQQPTPTVDAPSSPTATSVSSPDSSNIINNNNIISGNVIQPGMPPDSLPQQVPDSGFFSASKNSANSGTISNQVESFANRNPYSATQPQQSVFTKDLPSGRPQVQILPAKTGSLPVVNTPNTMPVSGPTATRYNQFNSQQVQQQQPQQPQQQMYRRPLPNAYPQQTANMYQQRNAAQQVPNAYQRAANPYQRVASAAYSQTRSAYPRAASGYQANSAYAQQRRYPASSQAADQFALMHFMQTAA